MPRTERSRFSILLMWADAVAASLWWPVWPLTNSTGPKSGGGVARCSVDKAEAIVLHGKHIPEEFPLEIKTQCL